MFQKPVSVTGAVIFLMKFMSSISQHLIIVTNDGIFNIVSDKFGTQELVTKRLGKIVQVSTSCMCVCLVVYTMLRPTCCLSKLPAKSIDSFIHSAISIAPLQVLLLLRGAPDYSTDPVSQIHTDPHTQPYI